jgi:hypothetical protein
MIYVNSENTNEVVVFDPKSLQVKKRFPITGAKTPTGLAYDAKTNRLFIGCRNEPKMIGMDAASGKIVASFLIGGNVDYAAFDPAAKLVFFSCGEGTLSIYHQKVRRRVRGCRRRQDDAWRQDSRVRSQDQKIFLTAAEYDEKPATEPGKRPQRVMKPDTFMVLVVSK